jgi:hypothetical protein
VEGSWHLNGIESLHCNMNRIKSLVSLCRLSVSSFDFTNPARKLMDGISR